MATHTSTTKTAAARKAAAVKQSSESTRKSSARKPAAAKSAFVVAPADKSKFHNSRRGNRPAELTKAQQSARERWLSLDKDAKCKLVRELRAAGATAVDVAWTHGIDVAVVHGLKCSDTAK